MLYILFVILSNCYLWGWELDTLNYCDCSSGVPDSADCSIADVGHCPAGFELDGTVGVASFMVTLAGTKEIQFGIGTGGTRLDMFYFQIIDTALYAYNFQHYLAPVFIGAIRDSVLSAVMTVTPDSIALELNDVRFLLDRDSYENDFTTFFSVGHTFVSFRTVYSGDSYISNVIVEGEGGSRIRDASPFPERYVTKEDLGRVLCSGIVEYCKLYDVSGSSAVVLMADNYPEAVRRLRKHTVYAGYYCREGSKCAIKLLNLR